MWDSSQHLTRQEMVVYVVGARRAFRRGKTCIMLVQRTSRQLDSVGSHGTRGTDLDNLIAFSSHGKRGICTHLDNLIALVHMVHVELHAPRQLDSTRFTWFFCWPDLHVAKTTWLAARKIFKRWQVHVKLLGARKRGDSCRLIRFPTLVVTRNGERPAIWKSGTDWAQRAFISGKKIEKARGRSCIFADGNQGGKSWLLNLVCSIDPWHIRWSKSENQCKLLRLAVWQECRRETTPGAL